jgi:hypothetical protein
MPDILSVTTAVDISAIQTGLPQAASLVEQATGRMSAAFKDAQGASRAASAEIGGISKGLGAVSEAAHGAGSNVRYAFLGLKDLGEGRYRFALAELANELIRMGGTTLAIGVVAGAVAGVGFAAYEAIKGLKEMAEQPHKIDLAFHQLDTTIQTSIDQLDNENARLSVTIAKLEGKPDNLLAVELTDAYLAADKLNEALERIDEKLAKVLKESSVGTGFAHPINTLLGVAGTSDIEDYIKKYQELEKEINYAGSQNVHRPGNTADQVKQAQKEWDAALDEMHKEVQQKLSGWLTEAKMPHYADGWGGTSTRKPDVEGESARIDESREAGRIAFIQRLSETIGLEGKLATSIEATSDAKAKVQKLEAGRGNASKLVLNCRKLTIVF